MEGQTRKELQALAKQNGIRANMKSADIITELRLRKQQVEPTEQQAVAPPPETPPPASDDGATFFAALAMLWNVLWKIICGLAVLASKLWAALSSSSNSSTAAAAKDPTQGQPPALSAAPPRTPAPEEEEEEEEEEKEEEEAAKPPPTTQPRQRRRRVKPPVKPNPVYDAPTPEPPEQEQKPKPTGAPASGLRRQLSFDDDDDDEEDEGDEGQGSGSGAACEATPRCCPEHERVASLKPMRGTLWGGGSPTPTEEDVQQGQLNNCYLCCALTVVASIEHGPAAIRRCFPGCCFPGKKQQQQQQQQGNGSRSNLPSRFAVRLHGGAVKEGRRVTREQLAERNPPQTFVVDTDTWHHKTDRTELYTHSPNGAMWPALLEKAYLLLRGGACAQIGGRGGEPLSYAHLEGGGVLGEGNCENVVRAIEPRLGARNVDLAYTAVDLAALFADGRNVAFCAGTRSKPASLFEAGDGAALFANHCYLVLRGAVEKGGELCLAVRNPHNRGGRGAKAQRERQAAPGPQMHRLQSVVAGRDGEKEKAEVALVKVADFSKYFQSLTVFTWVLDPSETEPIGF
jgi:hypothetical protein